MFFVLKNVCTLKLDTVYKKKKKNVANYLTLQATVTFNYLIMILFIL